MLVSEIAGVTQSDSEHTFDTSLSQVRINDDGVNIGDQVFPVEESTIRSFGSLLDISQTYLKKCPPSLAADNINYWLRERSEQEAMVHVINGHARFMKTSVKVVPLRPVLDIIERVFAPDDEIAEFISTDQMTHIDVISQEHRIEVPGKDTPLRPDNDYTHGGMRFRISSDYRVRPPEVMTYLNRRVCTNGMCIADAQYKLTLHGNTVEDVITEMESVATELWGKLPDALQTFRSTADVEIPGEVAHFIHKISTEQGVGMRITGRVLERVGELPTPATMYDVINLFTSVANEDVTYKTRESLQTLGGLLASQPDVMVHRCGQCERLL